MRVDPKDVGEKQHVDPQRILEVVTNWNVTLSDAEQEHMKACPECVSLFIRFMDERAP
jgi:hypothetical protein